MANLCVAALFVLAIAAASGAEAADAGYYRAGDAVAKPQEETQGGGHAVVTSLDDCLAKLDEQARAAVMALESGRWVDCNRRRELAAQAAAGGKTEQMQGGYVRVAPEDRGKGKEDDLKTQATRPFLQRLFRLE